MCNFVSEKNEIKKKKRKKKLLKIELYLNVQMGAELRPKTWSHVHSVRVVFSFITKSAQPSPIEYVIYENALDFYER